MKKTFKILIGSFVCIAILININGCNKIKNKESNVKAELSSNNIISRSNADMEENTSNALHESFTIQQKDKNIASNNQSNKSVSKNEVKINKTVISTKLVKRANIIFKVKDLKNSRYFVNSVSQSYNGYIANEEQINDQENGYFYFHIKVPNENFDKFVEKIMTFNGELLTKNINVDDVTKQFYDIEIRLNNKRKLEETYINLLKQAKNIEEILDIQEKIENIIEDIESTEGNLNVLKNQIEFSSVDLKIQLISKEKPVTERTYWSKLSNAFSLGWDSIKDLIEFLFSIWPFLIVLLILSFFGLKNLKKYKKSKLIENTIKDSIE